MQYHHTVSGLSSVQSYVTGDDANSHIQEYYWSKIKVVGPFFYYNNYNYEASIVDDCSIIRCYAYTPDEAKTELMEKMGF